MPNLKAPAIAPGLTIGLVWGVLSYLVGDLTAVNSVLVGLVMGVLCTGVWVVMDRVMSRRRHHGWQSRP